VKTWEDCPCLTDPLSRASLFTTLNSFEIFDIDPFWVPRTEEELEDLGEHGERENVAKRYMDKVRKRKVSRGRAPHLVLLSEKSVG
jgi:hypothetical protein